MQLFCSANVARLVLASLIAFSALSTFTLHAQPKPDAPPAYNVKENYTKYEYRIPMRDGKKLFTTVYAPKDSTKPAPFLMVRTPYSVAPYGVDQGNLILPSGKNVPITRLRF